MEQHSALSHDIYLDGKNGIKHSKSESNYKEYKDNLFISTPNMTYLLTQNSADPESKEQQPENKDELPNEPVKTWLLLINIFLFNAIFGYHFLSYGMYYVELTLAFDTTKASAGLIGAIHGSVLCSCGIFAAVLLEKYGPKRCGTVGALISAFGIFCSSFAIEIQMLYVTYGVITGIGIAIACLPPMVLIQSQFTKHRQFATSISFVGLPVGNLIGPNLTNYLLQTFGWRGALMIHSGIILNSIVLAQMWPSQNANNTKDSSADSKNMCKRFVDLTVLKNPLVSLFIASNFVYRIALSSIIDHTPSRAVFLGSDMQQAAFLITAFCFGSMIFRTLSSFVLSLRFANPIAIFSSLMVIQGVAGLLITIAKSYKEVLLAMLLIGCAQGFVVPCFALSLVRLTSVSKFARASAITNLFVGVSALLATPVTGWLFDITQNYDVPFYVAGAAAILGGAILFSVFLIDQRLIKGAQGNKQTEDSKDSNKQTKQAQHQQHREDMLTRKQLRMRKITV